jgi:hypothetical protein
MMVLLGDVELHQRLERGGDRRVEQLRSLDLRDVSLRDESLGFVGVEDRGTVLRADVRALTVELRGIVRDREEDLQDLAECDAGRVEDDLDRLGVAGRAGADVVVMGRLSGCTPLRCTRSSRRRARWYCPRRRRPRRAPDPETTRDRF